MTFHAGVSHIVTKQAAARLTPDAPASESRGRNQTVDALRGVAALAVVWFHVNLGNPLFHSGFLRSTGTYGWTGVDVFFVISGYILPYSLHRRGYTVRDFSAFLARRIVRLEPPYIASIAVCLILAAASTHLPNYGGRPFHVDATSVLMHLTYTTGLLHGTWWNPVYWTLAVELQFYLLIGLCFPLLAHRHRASVFVITALAVAAAALIPALDLIPLWLPAFAAGIITYQLHAHDVSARSYHIALALLTVALVFLYEPVPALVICATALAIAYVHIRSRVLLYYGGISYSLYLLHVPIGGRVINLAVRMNPGPAGTIIALIGAVLVSTLAAHIFNRLIELPSRAAASRIGSGHNGDDTCRPTRRMSW